MRRQCTSLRGVLIAGTIATLAAIAYAQAPRRSGPLILAADEGDPVGNNYIKADPHTGSMRLAVGLQRFKGGRGISMHMHDQEDEILFVHSGSGVGTVGDTRKSISAGTTVYIPQGTWHGVESQSDEMEILWVVSPPHFSETLRERAAKVSSGGKVSSGELAEILRRHGYRDSDQFFNPRLATIAATLAFAGAFVTLLSRRHPLRATALYALGATLATIVTLYAIGPGYLPPIAVALSAVIIVVAVFVGALAGVGIRSFTRRVTGASARSGHGA